MKIKGNSDIVPSSCAAHFLASVFLSIRDIPPPQKQQQRAPVGLRFWRFEYAVWLIRGKIVGWSYHGDRAGAEGLTPPPQYLAAAGSEPRVPLCTTLVTSSRLSSLTTLATRSVMSQRNRSSGSAEKFLRDKSQSEKVSK
ncbi:hypothetical protein Fcan01_05500 [Folsomia candida]|uniref:Uncharacterized protein n=1 Tax=Folsomia candida TaxID=158441 RepID=A0A226EPR8_FOLCA|nr:hypothetical protein Fcan01_05500 [Folsomia candida]